jgi:hypothetical protein
VTDDEQLAKVPASEEDWNSFFKFVMTSLSSGAGRMDRMEEAIQSNSTQIQENTDLTKELKAGTAELVEAFKLAKSGFKALEWLGRLAKPIGVIGGAIGGLYAAWQVLLKLFSK